MRNKQILLSGRAVTTNAANVPADRYSFLHLSDAEPNLGTASANGWVLVYDTATPGNRLWSEKLITGYNHANAAYASQNVTGTYANNAYAHANSSYLHANAAYQSQNVTGTYANNAYARANSSYLHANAAYQSQNVTGTYANNAYAHANAAYTQANSAQTLASSAFVEATAVRALAQNYIWPQANAAFLKANSAYAQANSASLYANGAFIQSNAAYTHANAAYTSQNVTGTYANNAYLHANAAYLHANAAYTSQNVTGTYANNAYVRANNSLDANVGGVVTGNVTVTQNLTVTGNISVSGNLFTSIPANGNTSAYATKYLVEYNPVSREFSYSSTPNASNPYITGYSSEIHVSPVAFNDSGKGTIGDPVKTIARAKELLALAFETTAVGQRKTIILHPGDYAEDVTIDTQFTALTTHELIGKNTTLTGTLTITKGCTIEGLKMTNLVISATAANGTVDLIGCTVSTAVTKTSSAYTVLRGCDLSSATLSVTGAGNTILVGGNYGSLTVNNASAGVLAKSVITMGPITLTAGTLQIADTIVYSATNSSNAITQSAGSVLTLNNSQILIPALTNVSRVNLGGFYSILHSVYDKPNSTLSGTSLNAISYSQYINADRVTLSADGRIVFPDATIQTTAAAPYAYSNASYLHANNAYLHANSAYVRANNSLNANVGGLVTGNVTVQGDLSITGNVFVLGNTFSIDAGSLVANDTLLLLGQGNFSADLLDIGISSHYNDGTNAHTGLIRDAGTKEWHLFKNYTLQVSSNNNINISDPSFTIDTLNANLHSEYVRVRGTEIGYYANAAFLQANSAYAAQNVTGTYANNAYDQANSAASYANGAFVKANSAYAAQNVTGTYANNAYLHANGAYIHANSAYNTINSLSAIANTTNTTIIAVNDLANAAFIKANSAYAAQNVTGTYANNAYLHANASFEAQNITGSYANSAYIHANLAYTHANSAYASQNITGTYANNAYTHANAAFLQANSAYASQNVTGTYANAAFLHANAAYQSQNVTGTYANNAYLHANASYAAQNVTGTYANNAYSTANNAYLHANAAFEAQNTTAVYANAAFLKTNSAYQHANSAYDSQNVTLTYANSGYQHANLAYLHANAAFEASNNAIDGYVRPHANASYNTANAAFAKANAAVFSITATTNETSVNTSTGNVQIGLANVNVNIGTFGGATAIPVINVDGKGRVLSVSNTTISVPPGTYIFPNTNQLTTNANFGNVLIGLANVNSNIGTFGSEFAVPTITTDGYGRVTSISNTTISIPQGTYIVNSNLITSNSSSGNVVLGLAPSGVSAGVYGGAGKTPVLTVDTYGRVTVASNVDSSVDTLSTMIRNSFTATAAQTIFQTSTSFQQNYADVYVNGIKLSSADYTQNGVLGQITLNAPILLDGDVVDIQTATTYIVNSNTNYQKADFVATAGQTTVTVSYVPGQVNVYLNGLRLKNGTDYTATNGTSIVFPIALELNDIVEVEKIGNAYIQLANSYFMTRNTITVTANGQTTFTVGGGYRVGAMDVYYNGIKLNNPNDVTATNGTTITLVDASSEVGDFIEVVGIGSLYQVADAIPITGGTVYGSLNVVGSITGNTINVYSANVTSNLQVSYNVTANAINVATVYFNDGTQMITAASGSGTGITWKIISANTTANTTEGFLVNTTSANVYITLNASPSLGNTARIVDMAGNFAINNCIIKGNGNKIMGTTDDFIISSNNAGIGLVYSNATYGWRIIENP